MNMVVREALETLEKTVVDLIFRLRVNKWL